MVSIGNDPRSGQWSRKIPLSRDDLFDIASCQFAMHYMFQSVQKARNFFREISSHLRAGGLFIATTIDCAALVELFAELIYGQVDIASTSASLRSRGIRLFLDDSSAAASEDSSDAATSGGDVFAAIRKYRRMNPFRSADGSTNLTAQEEERLCGAIITNEANNTLLRVSFKVGELKKLFALTDASSPTVDGDDGYWESAFGIQYSFSLFESSDTSSSAAVDAPEWIVPVGRPLYNLAEEVDMFLIKKQNFHSAVHEAILDPSKKQWYRFFESVPFCFHTILCHHFCLGCKNEVFSITKAPCRGESGPSPGMHNIIK